MVGRVWQSEALGRQYHAVLRLFLPILYALDPGELRNLAGEPAHAATKEELKAQIRKN